MTRRRIQRLHVLEDRLTIAEHALRFLANATLDVGMLREEMKRPRQQIRGGLVTGEVVGDNLVAELLVAHALARRRAGVRLLGRRHQHAEQVAAELSGLRGLGAALRDQPEDDIVNRLLGLLEAHVGRRRDVRRDGEHRLRVGVEAAGPRPEVPGVLPGSRAAALGSSVRPLMLKFVTQTPPSPVALSKK